MPDQHNLTQRRPIRAILTPLLTAIFLLLTAHAPVWAQNEPSRPGGLSAWGVLLAALAVLIIGLYVQSIRKRIH